ncbi:hypothetical protein [Hymenobacter sp. CRA2]|uniref:hypothetical protein n=1 Tax=Hymenobacter sp. CRA2 TaxID=1955620 RepID=UPI00098FEC75|nr:hypothetical protein [Hymenobacter sp. CRA2]OON67810.1 hypothetical protein B0919_16630 [Hymenobacter sp. CRA2]
MLHLDCKITFDEKLTVDFVHAIDIESSWQTLTDTCTIKLPRNVHNLNRQGQLPGAIKVGARVRVEYGYGAVRPEFTGYVVGVKEGPPCEIQCEDDMWLLKRKPLTKSWRQVTLQQLLEYVRSQSGQHFAIQTLGSTNLGRFAANQETGAQLLDRLRKDFGLFCFFRAGVLVAGDPYQALKTAPRHTLAFRRNVISNDLQYTAAENIRLKVRCISHLASRGKGRQRIVKEFGDQDGELRTFNFADVPADELIKRGKAELAHLRFTGYRGTITTFGEPLVEHGHVVQVQDPDYTDRDGYYSVNKVVKSFGVSGSRRVITLGPKEQIDTNDKATP